MRGGAHDSVQGRGDGAEELIRELSELPKVDLASWFGLAWLVAAVILFVQDFQGASIMLFLIFAVYLWVGEAHRNT